VISGVSVIVSPARAGGGKSRPSPASGGRGALDSLRSVKRSITFAYR
jgi:hypothetical protein